MNENGTPKNLIVSQIGNVNASKSGVYSKRMRAPRAEEIAAELTKRFGDSPLMRQVIRDVAGLEALIEAADAEIGARGVVGRGGRTRDVVSVRIRASNRLARARLEMLDLYREEQIAEQRQAAAEIQKQRRNEAVRAFVQEEERERAARRAREKQRRSTAPIPNTEG